MGVLRYFEFVFFYVIFYFKFYFRERLQGYRYSLSFAW